VKRKEERAGGREAETVCVHESETAHVLDPSLGSGERSLREDFKDYFIQLYSKD
jgi:hypothetical protein